MIVLVSGATATLRTMSPAEVGGLLQPRAGNRPEEYTAWGMRFALDNDCYQALDRRRYLAMLRRCRGLGPLWVTAPDVVGDAYQTLLRFRIWRPVLRYYGYPVAYVAQDGCTLAPWAELDCLFIGGTTAFKLGPVAAALAQEAKRRGKWVHMGRVNSRKRMTYAGSIGCDSVDGTGVSRYSATHLPWVVEYMKATQHRLGGV